MAKKKTSAEKRKEERQSYQKLERRLVLLAWLNAKFGFKENKSLLENVKNSGDGFDEESRSYVTGLLISRGEKCQIPRADLERYDANIRAHLNHINRLRTRPIVLRYFQHLALLYAEIYLDRYFNHRANLLAELNLFVGDRNIDKLPGDPEDTKFTTAELRKLADAVLRPASAIGLDGGHETHGEQVRRHRVRLLEHGDVSVAEFFQANS